MPSHSTPFQTSFLQDYAVSLVNVHQPRSRAVRQAQRPVHPRRHVRAHQAYSRTSLLSTRSSATRSPTSPSLRAQAMYSRSPKSSPTLPPPSRTGEVSELQAVLEALDVRERLQKALVVLKKELMNAQLQSKISKDVESKIQKRQREYYLMEQLKGIKKELGIESDGKDKMIEKFREKAAELRMPEAVRKVFDEELNQTPDARARRQRVQRDARLSRLAHQHPLGRPLARELLHLERDLRARRGPLRPQGRQGPHPRVPRRRKAQGYRRGQDHLSCRPSRCGKTSIGKSIARAVERQFFRFSVGGLSDVAEIKGHRRTYVGAMPGKAIQALKKVGTENPLILIDEVDKIGRGHNGDPSSALLEMLDPEQNGSFLDHYMDVPRRPLACALRLHGQHARHHPAAAARPYGGHGGVIVHSGREAPHRSRLPRPASQGGVRPAGCQHCAARRDDRLPHQAPRARERSAWPAQAPRKGVPQDRIRHCQGARRVGVPGAQGGRAGKRQDRVGVGRRQPSPPPPPNVDGQAAEGAAAPSAFTEPSASTSEAPDSKPLQDGKVPGKDAAPEPPAKVTTEKRQPMAVPKEVKVEITIDSLRKYLGPPVYHKDRLYTSAMPAGVSTGLGYLGNGSGSLMPIETTIMPGKGSLQLTGKLGDVIKESASIALSWMKTNAFDLGIVKDAGGQLAREQGCASAHA
ncbi:hypothetical protein L1887_57197 [Cichorium endivia]|nr:hypothetical protein L1887_57197 [Cichorium endivia]